MQIGCTDLFEDVAVQTFNACAISNNDCVPQRVDSDAEWPVSRLTVLLLDGVLGLLFWPTGVHTCGRHMLCHPAHPGGGRAVRAALPFPKTGSSPHVASERRNTMFATLFISCAGAAGLGAGQELRPEQVHGALVYHCRAQPAV